MNYFYWVRSFGFGDVHFIVRLCHVTIALVFKLVTWIWRHRGLAITACKAGLRILSDDNLQQQDENASQAGEEMSTADAVSLFTTSLNSALAQQKQDILSELQPNRQFKQEGTKKQLNFNSESIDTLGRISSLISQCKFDDTRALINSVLDTLCQRNKILKIADRHGWDTVNEYLDDPLADNNEDASKLRQVANERHQASKIRADLTQRAFSWHQPGF